MWCLIVGLENRVLLEPEDVATDGERRVASVWNAESTGVWG